MSNHTEFLTPLLLEYLDGRDYRVLRKFIYEIREGDRVVVPAGFVTDFASVPRFLWRVLPPTGKYGKAAVVHDYLYRTSILQYSRAEADLIFYEAMEDLGVNAWVSKLMYWAVRAFGRSAYKERT